MLDKHQDTEEPCEVKVSSTVLKTNGVGDNLVEFNQSGVLIYAARAEGLVAQRALDVLKAPDRVFASSIFVKLEVLPKAIFNGVA